MNSEHNCNVPLPDNVELLSTGEILGLLREHRNQLQSYVTKFHPQDKLKQEVNELRSQLELLESWFRKLEEEKTEAQKQLEECRIMEAQYVKIWQDLHHKMLNKYHENALKEQLESQIQHCNNVSIEQENDVGEYKGLDGFLDDFIKTRTQYHLRREKLATWNHQGTLKT